MRENRRYGLEVKEAGLTRFSYFYRLRNASPFHDADGADSGDAAG